jgi:hypothetical protein
MASIWNQPLKPAKIVIGFLFLALFASNVWTISRWNETRGVYDDLCYLRQAHLLQRFGVSGFDTDLKKDDDGFMAGKLRAINFAEWNDPLRVPCHTPMERTKKIVLQYPPGTGAALALFPEGFQVIPLYVTASLVIAGFAMLALMRASTPRTLTLAAVFGLAALYLMINPTKASYSMAPTMLVCAAAGLFTARLFAATAARERVWLAIAVGFLIGLSVNFRLPNLLLSGGYCIVFLAAFLIARNRQTFAEGFAFGIALVIGLAPTLVANAINAGSPFATTYGGPDVAPPELSMSVLKAYLGDSQFVLLLVTAAWTAIIWRDRGTRQVAWVVAVNLAVNIAFFVSHPLFTQYYTIPVAMLSLWTLLFTTLPARPAAAANNPTLAQPAKA